MSVVFVCKSVHLKDDFFRATQLDHRLSEPRVTDKSIVNVFILFLSTHLLKLFCRVEFFATFFLPVPVTVWPAFPDVKVRDREEIQHGRDVLLVFCCIISQEVSAQDQYRPKIPRLGASSMHCACIARDVVQRSQYVQGLCDFHLLDQQARRTLFVFCSNIDLQVYQSIVDNRMKIECASDVVNVRKYSSSNHHIVP